jgi:hypothetical protein
LSWRPSVSKLPVDAEVTEIEAVDVQTGDVEFELGQLTRAGSMNSPRNFSGDPFGLSPAYSVQ